MTVSSVLSSSYRPPAIGAAALIVVATCIAYLPAVWGGGFVWDDDSLLTENELIQDPAGLNRIWFTTDPIDYWPVSNSSLWFEWRLWGNHPLGYHVTNLALHIGAALLLWKILQSLAVPGAWLAALLFAVHPVNVETVAWIAQRKTLLAEVFCLLSMLWYLRADVSAENRNIFRSGWYWWSLLAFLLGMLSKGSIAILPLLLLVMIWWRRDRIALADLARVAPYFLISVPLVLVNIWFQNQSGEVIRTASFAERLAGADAVPWFYLSKALLPARLMFVYSQWDICTTAMRDWLPLAVTVAVTTGLWWWWRDRPWCRAMLFAWAMFCLSLVPVMGLTDVYFMKYSLVADHYQYLAISAVMGLVAAAWSYIYHGARDSVRATATTVAAIVVVVFMAISWRQCRMYPDSATLWRTTIEKNPRCWMAYNNLASTLIPRDPQAAIPLIEQALQLKPDYAEAHNNMAAVLLKIGRPQEAIEHCREALRLKLQFVQAFQNLGTALLDAGRPQEAIEPLEQALKLKPNYPEAHNNLGNALVSTGAPQEAVEHYVEAIKINPQFPDAHNNLGALLLNSGQPSEALEHFEQAWRLRPGFAAAGANCARTYAALHRPAEAIAAGEKALGLARAQGQTALAQQIEHWLNSQRTGEPNSPAVAPQTPPP